MLESIYRHNCHRDVIVRIYQQPSLQLARLLPLQYVDYARNAKLGRGLQSCRAACTPLWVTPTGGKTYLTLMVHDAASSTALTGHCHKSGSM